jgi:hypothetical protein
MRLVHVLAIAGLVVFGAGCEVLSEIGPSELALTETADLAAFAELEALSTAEVAGDGLDAPGRCHLVLERS